MLLSEMFRVICVLNFKYVLTRFFTNMQYFHMIAKAINSKNVLFHFLAISWKNIAKIDRNILEFLQMICTIKKCVICCLYSFTFIAILWLQMVKHQTSFIKALHSMHTQCLLYVTHFNWHVLCISLNFFWTHSVVVLKISEHNISF